MSLSRILWLTAVFVGFLALGIDVGYAAGVHAKRRALDAERIDD